MKPPSPILASLLRTVIPNISDSTTANSSDGDGGGGWVAGDDLEAAYSLLRSGQLHQLVPLTIVLGVITVVGAVGNALVIAVFARSLVQQTSTHFMVCLALVDLVVCTVSIPGVLVKEWFYPFRSDLLCKLWELVNMATIPASALLLSAIALDRYLLVCGPRTGPRAPTWPRLAIAASLGAGLALSVPPMLSVGTYQRDAYGRAIRYLGLCEPNYILLSQHWLATYWHVVTSVFCVVLIIIIFMYTAIFLKVFRHKRKMARTWPTKVQHPQAAPRPPKRVPKPNPPAVGLGPLTPPTPPPTSKPSLQALIAAPPPPQPRLQPRLPTLVEADETAQVTLQPIYVIPVQVVHCGKDQVHLSTKAKAKRSLARNSSDSGIEDSTEDLQERASTDNRGKAEGVPIPTSCTTTTTTSSSSSGDDEEERKGAATSIPVTQGSQQRRRAHVKTVRVLVLVTAIYVVAFLPAFLMSHGLVPESTVVFYLYFLHSAANPLLYAFMNCSFRQALTRVCSFR